MHYSPGKSDANLSVKTIANFETNPTLYYKPAVRIISGLVEGRDDHGNGIPNGNGNPMGFPWERELVTKLGMGMGRNGKQPVWEWEWPLFPRESIPIGGYSVKFKLM